MKWQDAVKQTGFAYRTLANGETSIKAKDGRQWTTNFDSTDNYAYLDSMELRYSKADRYTDWLTVNVLTEIWQLLDTKGVLGIKKVVTPKVGYKHIQDCINLRCQISNLGKAIGEGEFDEDQVERLDTLIRVATLLREALQ